jgi:hypothetical protein
MFESEIDLLCHGRFLFDDRDLENGIGERVIVVCTSPAGQSFCRLSGISLNNII